MRTQLLRQINRYLSGKASLRDMETWLLQHLQGVLESGEVEAIALANQVDADLMELSEGWIDVESLNQRLQNYIRSAEIMTG